MQVFFHPDPSTWVACFGREEKIELSAFKNPPEMAWRTWLKGMRKAFTSVCTFNVPKAQDPYNEDGASAFLKRTTVMTVYPFTGNMNCKENSQRVVMSNRAECSRLGI